MTVEYLDMQLRNIPKKIKKENNIENGVIVVKNENYALYKNLGIQPNYIITEINGQKINSVDDINNIKQKYGNEVSKIGIINNKGQKENFIFR